MTRTLLIWTPFFLHPSTVWLPITLTMSSTVEFCCAWKGLHCGLELSILCCKNSAIAFPVVYTLRRCVIGRSRVSSIAASRRSSVLGLMTSGLCGHWPEFLILFCAMRCLLWTVTKHMLCCNRLQLTLYDMAATHSVYGCNRLHIYGCNKTWQSANIVNKIRNGCDRL